MLFTVPRVIEDDGAVFTRRRTQRASDLPAIGAPEIAFAGHPTVGCAIHLAQKKYKPGCSFETTIRLSPPAASRVPKAGEP